MEAQTQEERAVLELCPHTHRTKIDAIGILRAKCVDCGAVLYDDDDGQGFRFYRCSYTAWGYCEKQQKRRRKRCCSQIPTEWYQDAAYCKQHRPTSRYVEDEKEWRAKLKENDDRGVRQLQEFAATCVEVRASVLERPLPPPVVAAPEPSVDYRTMQW